jgi:putative ABC transport system permease protein
MENLTRELWRSIRSLSRTPGFTATVILTLGLGIGVNTAIFSVVNAVLLEPLPFPESERVVVLTEHAPGVDTSLVSPITFDDWETRSQLFEHLAAFRFWENQSIQVDDREPEPVLHVTATPDFFAALRFQPAFGRIYADQQDGGVKEAVLSDELWRGLFNADTTVVGRTVRMSGAPYIIVGVMPPVPMDVSIGMGDIWSPLPLYNVQQRRATSFRARYLRVVGRLKPGITVGQAQAQMSILQRQLEEEATSVAKGYSVRVESLKDTLTGRIRPVLLILMAAVGIVLLGACANVGNLALARGVAREKEVSIRLALGAGYHRIVREFLIESLVLSAAGAVAGIGLAYAGLFCLKYYLVSEVPRLDRAGLSIPALLFTVAVVIVCAAVVGLVTSIGYLRRNLQDTLKESSRGGSGSVRRQRLRKALVASEVVFAVVLLVGAGFLVKSVAQLMRLSPGFEVDKRVVVDVVLPSIQYDDEPKRTSFFRAMFSRLSETSGVEAAGGSLYFPCRPKLWLSSVWREGVEVPEGQEPIVYYNLLAGDYFTAMGIPLRRGRTFTEQEMWERRDVIMINETLAKQVFPDVDPVERRIKISKGGRWLTVVGIVGDVRQKRLDEAPKAEFYVPFSEMPMTFLTLVAKTKLPAESAAPAIRSAVRSLSPDLGLHNLMSLEDLVTETISTRQIALVLLLLFSALALTLAAIGIYGVVSYIVGQREQEIGVRIALGATPRDILLLIAKSNARVIGAAVLIGLLLAAAGTRTLTTLIYDVSAIDLSIYLGVCVVALVVALAATCIPAVRAAVIDPVRALRQE